MTKSKAINILVLFSAIFVLCVCMCFFNFETLKAPLFQRKTTFSEIAFAKYEKDGNIYIVDSGFFRLVCMTPQGNIKYTISIDKSKDYTRMYDIAVDEDSNLYAYMMKLEYNEDAKLQDTIVKYNANGEFVQTIFKEHYEKDNPDRAYTFPQFGSLHCEDSILTFSHVQREQAVLYRYDTRQRELFRTNFTGNTGIAQLTVKDFD
ncbi:MAG: hypothetical protein LBH18_03750, partial [Spirochaetaceae bacterium]|nr:hypothetical protein [Spirochaetaceae bacterium]